MSTAKPSQTETSPTRDLAEFPIRSKPTQSLGKWIDNLMGDRRHRERARKKVQEVFARIQD